jgi:hypothetical protein
VSGRAVGTGGVASAPGMEPRFARAAVVIGVASVLSAAFVVTPALPEFIDLVDVSPAVAVVFVVLGVVAIVGGLRRSAVLCAIAGWAFLVAAAAQLVQFASGIPVLGGDASSLALFGAWGVGLLSLRWADRSTPLPTTPSPSKDG